MEQKQSKIKPDNYLVIQGFMVSEMGLKGNELLIYACIYGFSQAENQVYSGGLQYLADWANCSKRNVMNCLCNLEENGFIKKTSKTYNGILFNEYTVEKSSLPVKKVLWGGEKSSMGGGEKSSPNNIVIDNIENNISKREIYKEKSNFKKPTVEEITAYCRERNNNINAQHFYDYYSANGWKVGRNTMKDWKAAVRTWEQKEKPSKKTLVNNSFNSVDAFKLAQEKSMQEIEDMI